MDYYKILGLNKNCSTEEIKKSYKKLALIWHPDRNTINKKKAEAMFQKISEAYSVLSNENLRKKYDCNDNNIEFEFNNSGNPFDLFNSFFNLHNRNLNNFFQNDFIIENPTFPNFNNLNSNSFSNFSSRKESSKIINGNHIKETIIKENNNIIETYEVNGKILKKKITEGNKTSSFYYDNKGNLIKNN